MYRQNFGPYDEEAIRSLTFYSRFWNILSMLLFFPEVGLMMFAGQTGFFYPPFLCFLAHHKYKRVHLALKWERGDNMFI